MERRATRAPRGTILTMETVDLDGVLSRGRKSLRVRRARLRTRWWQVGQCAVAAGVSWWVARELLDHPAPVFAPIAAVVSLGTSYAQRLRRVGEVTAGVAIGVFLADMLVLQLGSGAWQIGLVVGLAMTAAVLLDAGNIFVTQSAIQSIFVVALFLDTDQSLTRWTDAVIGGAVALVAATVVPSAPLRRPRNQAAVVLEKVGELIRGSADVLVQGDKQRGLALLADARSTEPLIRELQDAADEGMAVVSSSPFRVRHRPGIRRMAELVEPLDRAVRSTRVLVRQVSVATYHGRPVPPTYVGLLDDLAGAIDDVIAELRADRRPVRARPALEAVGAETGRVERAAEMTAEAVLTQIRSVIADLLMLTGMDSLGASDLLPPPPT